MTPVLVPAFPAVLRRGLPLVWRRDDGSVSEPLLCTEAPSAYSTALWTENSYGGHCYADVEHESADGYWLDLRDAVVRDAVVRAIWRKLRPDEPEPLTAPIFDCETRPDELPSEDEDPPCWWLAHPLAPENGVAFGCLIESKDGVYRKVPALNDVDFASPDRDLLALAEVATAVLS